MKWMHQIFCVAFIAAISFNAVKSDGCNALELIECGGLVATCAVSCVDPLDGVCEACLGSAYSKCVGCISLATEINAVKTAPVKSESCSTGDAFTCAGLVALCTAACVDPLDGVCEACFGGAYTKCVGCISLTSEISAIETAPVKSESCSTGDAFTCAGLVALCTAACVDPLDGVCEACFGGAYAKCVGCISLTSKVNTMQIAAARSSLTSCSIFTAAKCAVKVAECTSSCVSDGLTSQSCTSCFGDLYSECIGCVTLNIAIKSRHDAAIQGCGTFTKIKCAVDVAKCGVDCYDNGITSSQCKKCFGSSYNSCKGCIKLEVEMRQLAIDQGCSTFEKIKCGVDVAKCSVDCYENGITSSQCKKCFGSSYNSCKGCIKLEVEMSRLPINQLR